MPIPVERLVLFDAVALLNLFVWFARFGYTLDVRAAITCNSVVNKLQVLGGIGAAPKHLAVDTSSARPRLASRPFESGDHITSSATIGTASIRWRRELLIEETPSQPVQVAATLFVPHKICTFPEY